MLKLTIFTQPKSAMQQYFFTTPSPLFHCECKYFYYFSDGILRGPGKWFKHLLQHPSHFVELCMLLDVDCWSGQMVSTHHQHLIQQSLTRGLVFCPRLQSRLLLWIWYCYYGYGHGYAIERLISAHAHTQQSWKTGANGFNFIQHSRTQKKCWMVVEKKLKIWTHSTSIQLVSSCRGWGRGKRFQHRRLRCFNNQIKSIKSILSFAWTRWMQLTRSGRSIVEVPEDGGKLLTELRGENHREHLLVQYYLQMSSPHIFSPWIRIAPMKLLSLLKYLLELVFQLWMKML